MRKPIYTLSLFTGLLLMACTLFTACGDDDEETSQIPEGDTDIEAVEVENDFPVPEFEPAGPDNAIDPMKWGPYPVGVRTIVYYDESRPDDRDSGGGPRRLVTEIWYPTTVELDEENSRTYDPKTEACAFSDVLKDMIGDVELGNFSTDTMPDVPVWPGTKFPLVLFSHGSGGIRFQSVFQTPQIASHGYIVVAPDHIGNTLWELIRDDWSVGATGAAVAVRPDDLRFLIDQMQRENSDPDSFLFGSVDLENIAAMGHSFGAVTSEIVGCVDDRVDIVISQAPVGGMCVIEGCTLPEYPKPMMIMGGTLDHTLQYQENMLEPYQDLGKPKAMVTILDGGHFTFSDICLLNLNELADQLDWSDARDALNDGCSPDFNVDYNEAHDMINHYNTAYLNYYLRGSTESRQYLKNYDDIPLSHAEYQEDWD